MELNELFDALRRVQTEIKPLTAVAGVADVPLVQVPEGFQVTDLSEYLDNPRAIHQQVNTPSLDDFCSYIQRYSNDSSIIFFSTDDGSAVCILDYHEAAGLVPHHGTHRALLSPQHSVEWSNWSSMFNRGIEQGDLAAFIEDNLDDFQQPDGARMLEIATKLNISQSITYRNQRTLENGDVALSIEVDSNAGLLEMPTKVSIAIPMFHGQAPIDVDMRFRYRLRDGGCLFYMKPNRLDLKVDAAMRAMVDDIHGATGLLVIRQSHGPHKVIRK